MKAASRKRNESILMLSLALLLTLTLAACGPDFTEGAYADSRFGTTYEFGAEGQGRIVGGVPGTPPFTYEVDGDEIVISYGQGQPGANFKRIDATTLERPDGTRLVLQE